MRGYLVNCARLKRAVDRIGVLSDTPRVHVFVAAIPPERSGRSKTPVIQRLHSHLGQCPVRNHHGNPNPNPKSVSEVVSACFSLFLCFRRTSSFLCFCFRSRVSRLSLSLSQAVASKHMFCVLRFFWCVSWKNFFSC